MTEKISPCKKCGHIPVGFKINFGTVHLNKNGDKPYSTDRYETVYSCINPDCGKEINLAVKKWNENQK